MTKDPLLVLSLAKAMNVLEAWGEDQRYLSLSEIASRTGLTKSAVQRFCHTFEKSGYLHKDGRTRRYALGTKVLDASHAFLRTHPVVEQASPMLLDLRRECGQHVKLSLFDDTTTVYAIRRQGERTAFSTSIAGRRLPIQTTAGGRAMLGALSDVRVADILSRAKMTAFTPRTEVDHAAIMRDVARVRSMRYSVLADQVIMDEIVVGAPVLDRDGEPVAAVHIAGNTGAWEGDAFERKFAPLALAAAQTISRYDAGSSRGRGRAA